MARPLRHTDTDIGWVNRRFKSLERQIREMRSERRFLATEIPDGFISNDALADPVGGGWVSLSATNFPLTTAGGNLLSSTVTVPAGFTSCIVSLVGRVYAINSTAADDYLYARPLVNAVTGTALPVHAGPLGAVDDGAVNVAPLSTVLSGLAEGGTFTVALWARTAVAGWTAQADNTADLTGTLTWF